MTYFHSEFWMAILNISSYSDLNLFWDVKTLEYDNKTIQIMDPPIYKIVLKLDLLITQFHYTIRRRIGDSDINWLVNCWII